MTSSRSSDLPAYSVVPSEEAMKDVDRVHLPGRKPCFPEIWKYRGHHPQLQRRPHLAMNNAYVYFIDVSIDGKQRARALAEAIRIPYGRIETMIRKEPGMQFF